MTEQQQQELRERIAFEIPMLNGQEVDYLLNALDENKALKERVHSLESILLSRPMADESTEQYIKNCLAVRGFNENTILNNRGLIGAIIDEMELLNTKTDKQ